MTSQRGRTLTAHFVGDADSLLRALNQVDRSAGQTEQSTTRLGGAVTGLRSNWVAATAALAAGAAALGGVTAATLSAISAASDYQESISKINVVFGESADVVTQWVDTQALAFRLSKREAAEATGTFGNLFVSLGQTSEAAAEMSVRMVELAGDTASFNNVPVEETLTALRSGIVGEIEPLRRLGVSFNAVAVENEALRLGLASTKSELTEGDKVLARYNLILAQSTTAQGDAARTSGQLAGQSAELTAKLDNLKTELGTKLVPAAEAALEAANNLLDVLEKLSNLPPVTVTIDLVIKGVTEAFNVFSALAEIPGAAGAAYQNVRDGLSALISGARSGLGGIGGGAGGIFGTGLGNARTGGSGATRPTPLSGFDLFLAQDQERFGVRGPLTLEEQIAVNQAQAKYGALAAGGGSSYGGAGGSVSAGVDPFELASQRAMQLAQKRMEELAFSVQRAAQGVDVFTAAAVASANVLKDLTSSSFPWNPGDLQNTLNDLNNYAAQHGGAYSANDPNWRPGPMDLGAEA